MSKVIKIKQSDIERIVEDIVSGQMDKENSDFSTYIISTLVIILFYVLQSGSVQSVIYM